MNPSVESAYSDACDKALKPENRLNRMEKYLMLFLYGNFNFTSASISTNHKEDVTEPDWYNDIPDYRISCVYILISVTVMNLMIFCFGVEPNQWILVNNIVTIHITTPRE